MRLTAAERDRYERDGYVVRESVFSPEEVADLRDVVEEVAGGVKQRATRDGAGPEVTLADGHRLQFSSRSAIQWEWRDGSQEIRLIEPVTHLHDRLDALMADSRLVEPMRDLLARDDVEPFTSKLNLKRAAEGSEFPYHQDYPYWYVTILADAADVATVVLFLDDSYASNGALRVLRGSHRLGPAPRDPQDPTRFLADPRRLDTSGEVTVEVPAGSLLMFGAFLVHRSSPNATGGDRRALLLSYQPAGRPRLEEGTFRPELVEQLP